MNVWSIIYAILILSGMILVHELGHYLFARIFDVHILEFSIGMGPKLLSRTSKKTGIVYSIRAFPIGGFVSMEGEDDAGESDRALNRKPVWQRMIITAAGAVMNLLLGFVLMLGMVLSSRGLGTTIVAEFKDAANSPVYQSGLRAEDEIIEVDGVRVHTNVELAYEIMHRATRPIDLTVLRDGEEMVLPDVVFPTFEEQGVTFGEIDFLVYGRAKTFGGILRQTWYQSGSCIKMVWESLLDLVTGRYGIESVSGPVGVTEAIGQAADVSLSSLLYLCTLISMNLGVFNLLPIPALDGGRLLFQFIELIRRKPIKPEVEGYIHTAGMFALLVLTVLITFKDIFGLFRR